MIMRRLHHAYTAMRESTILARQRNKARYDRKAQEMHYEPGDAVYWHHDVHIDEQDHKLPRKFRSPWKPYYRVVQRLSPYRYLIRRHGTDLTRTVYVEHLRPANLDSRWDVAPEPEEVIKEDTCEAEEMELHLPRVQPPRSAKFDEARAYSKKCSRTPIVQIQKMICRYPLFKNEFAMKRRILPTAKRLRVNAVGKRYKRFLTG